MDIYDEEIERYEAVKVQTLQDGQTVYAVMDRRGTELGRFRGETTGTTIVYRIAEVLGRPVNREKVHGLQAEAIELTAWLARMERNRR